MPIGEGDRSFFAWQIAMQTEPEFSECEITSQSINGATVACTAVDGGQSFWSQVTGLETNSTFTAAITPEGLLTMRSWPAPEGLPEAAVAFRQWIEEFHPEHHDVLLGTDYLGLALTGEAGELSMSLLPDYQAYLAAL